MPHELRDYQKEAVESIFTYFQKEKTGNPLVVAPTGSGKSLIIAEFARQVLTQWPSQRILVVAHRKELLEQNAQELWSQWPGAPIGIYSAGLNLRHLGRPLTIAGIGSVYRRASQLGHVDLLLIDEAHLVPSKGMGMYRTLIQELLAQNPHMRVIGLTATPFRLDQGFLHEARDDQQALFDAICYEIDVKVLIECGHLAPLIGKISAKAADLSDVRIRGGDYVERDMSIAFSKDDLIKHSVQEIIRYGQDRKSWLIFATGVEHADKVRDELRAQGVTAETVVGDTASGFRDSVVKKFRAGELQAVVNCGVFTTGFNAKNVDLIALLRATQSTGLYVQIMGRGMRTSPNKTNCLVLDFGGNIERHGPVDEIRIVSKGSGGKSVLKTMPMKPCPQCRAAIPLSATECVECGHLMPRAEAINHAPEATEASPMSDGRPQEIEVFQVTYNEHVKDDKPPSLKITYHAKDNRRVSEWLCFEHGGFATQKAYQIWQKAVRPEFKTRPIPSSTSNALLRIGELMEPVSVWVKMEEKFERIVSKSYPLIDQLPPLVKPVEDFLYDESDLIPF